MRRRDALGPWPADDAPRYGVEPDADSDGEGDELEPVAPAAAAPRPVHLPEAPLLTPQEELALAARVAQGDREARQKLIAANFRLVFHVVNRFRHTGIPLEDLIQEGSLGLVEAVDRFDSRHGCRFNTYALFWIRGAVLRATSHLRAGMPVPERLAQAAVRLRRQEDILAQELMRQPTDEEVAQRTGLTAERVEEARTAMRAVGSLDHRDDDEGATAAEWLLPSDDPPAIDVLEQAELTKTLRDRLNELTPRERDVVTLRYGLDTDEPRSLAEVGRALDISRQRARELEQSALRRLRRLPPPGAGLRAAGD